MLLYFAKTAILPNTHREIHIQTKAMQIQDKLNKTKKNWMRKTNTKIHIYRENSKQQSTLNTP